MRGIGTHARDTPEGLMISTRLVTSKVRHLVSPDVSAAMERRGHAGRPAEHSAPAGVFWKDGTRRRPRYIMKRALGSSSSPPIDVPKSPNIYSAVILL